MRRLAVDLYDRLPVLTISAMLGGALMLKAGWQFLFWIRL